MDELWDGLCVSSVVVVNNLVVCWATDDVWYKSLGIWVGVARGNKNARQAADAMIGAGRVVRRFRRNAACRAHIGFFTVSEWSNVQSQGGRASILQAGMEGAVNVVRVSWEAPSQAACVLLFPFSLSGGGSLRV